MFCPKCNKFGTKVIDSRMYPEGINIRWRKHECSNCGYRFQTEEKVIKPQTNDIQFDRIAYKNSLKLKRNKQK